MTPLEQVIIDRIRREGPITFEAFMDMALYWPGLGYYSSPESAIGRGGDFYTSPHLHPIFGAMIGKLLMEMWRALGKPGNFHAVEIGAGAGYLCKDIFDYLHKPSEDSSLMQGKNDFLSSLKYVIIEPFAHFEERQKGLLDDLSKNPPTAPFSKVGNTKTNVPISQVKREHFISWVKSLNELNDITGCIFSNELLDAFPVHLVEMDDELKEIYVNFNGKEFVEEKNKIRSEDIALYMENFAHAVPPGYRSEVNLRIRNWLHDVAAVLSRGFVLTIDYGYTAREYYDEDRSRGTLLCYHKHLFNEDPFQHIGQQDITAHVNFSSLKKWGEDLGLSTIGYCAQGTFLTASGIDEVITELYSDSKDYLSEISKIKGLIMPQGMGESHRFMVQYKGQGLPALRGFSMRNQFKNL